MFDVRPVDETGDLNWEKIQSIGEHVNLHEESESLRYSSEKSAAKAYILGVAVDSDLTPVLHDPNFRINDCSAEQTFKKDQEYLREIEQKNEILRVEIEQGKIKRQQILAQRNAHLERIKTETLRKQEEAKSLAELRRAQQEARTLEIQLEKEKREQERILQLELEKKRIEEQRMMLEQLQAANREKEALIAAEKSRIYERRQATIRNEAMERKMELQKIAEQNRAQQLSYEEAVRSEKAKRELEYENYLKEEKLSKRKELKNKKNLKGAWWFSEEQKKKNKNSNKKTSLQGIFSFRKFFLPDPFAMQFDSRSGLAMFAVVAIIFSFGIGGISYASKGLTLKGRVLGVSQDGYANLTSAVSEMSHQNFEGSTQQFSKALENFSQGSKELEDIGGMLLDVTRYFPFASKISSGKNAVEAGKHFSAAGQSLNEVVKISANFKNPLESNNEVSLLNVLESAEENIIKAKIELDSAKENVDQISIDDLPEDKRDKFLLLKQKLPDIISALDLFLNNNHILVELLGGNGPRKYLFLFQNNTEMRATGGFIGSYGLLDIANGHIKKFFIDGIFNPDGQLKDRIVPPAPIQKISANWSMHDSNWFADFPISARKAINFYEKTGGPTADGVITLTPTVMQKLLEITGPIEMSEYGVTLDSQNFIELTQYEVEVDYDKKENKPKKILSDLAPLVLERLMSSKDLESISKTAQALLSGFQEKHILLYSENKSLQEIISKQGWSGEVLPSSKDYLSVINTNINGYKTDAVVEENVTHKAEIQDDGSIIDTLTVTRRHSGGSSDYDWLNKVNANYMRVYVPEGSKLLEVSGQTREDDEAPLDYDALGFKRDDDVQKQEESVSIDSESGTKVYAESGKTVFANWTYVSPGETMTITYKYILPFSLFNVSIGDGEQVDSYSLVVQKQSGSVGSSLESAIVFPESYEAGWIFPENSEKNEREIKSSQSLKTDRYFGVVFEKKD
ncbi:MAG: hypothetical protein ACD_56C00112G0009 [uncultured bacterium]|nr:MAG: hypothetical protein ACD_56C00112G0009 [uncultured bacterium]